MKHLLLLIVLLGVFGPFAFAKTEKTKPQKSKTTQVQAKTSKEPGNKSKAKAKNKSRKVAHELNGYTAVGTDPDFDVNGLSGPGVSTYQHPQSFSEMPGPDFRDQVFMQAGISQRDLARYDQLDRDMLYMRCKTSSLQVLIQRYPNIPQGKLLKLKAVCK